MSHLAASLALVFAEVVDETGPPGNLSAAAHVFLIAGALGSTLFFLFLLRKRQLRGKYALLWTSMGLALIVLALFPGLLTAVSERLGINYPPALFLVVAIGFLLVVVMHFSWEMSRMEDRQRTLAEELALLRTDMDVRVADHDDETPAGRPER